MFGAQGQALSRGTIHGTISYRYACIFHTGLQRFGHLTIGFVLRPDVPINLINRIVNLTTSHRQGPSRTIKFLYTRASLAYIRHARRLLSLHQAINVTFHTRPYRDRLRRNVTYGINRVRFTTIYHEPRFTISTRTQAGLGHNVLEQFHDFFLGFRVKGSRLSKLFL